MCIVVSKSRRQIKCVVVLCRGLDFKQGQYFTGNAGGAAC